MKSFQFDEYGGPLSLHEHALAEPSGDEVLLRVHACGVCHSDVHVWEGHFDMGGGRKADLRSGRELPFTLGHEILGEVVAVGDTVRGVRPGDRRLVYPWIGCGVCPLCMSGDEHLCMKSRALGVNVAGGYSDHVRVPHPRYLFDPGTLAPELACTYACSGLTAYAALGKLKTAAQGRSLLVIGAGGVGMAGLAIARALLETTIVVADIDAAKLEAAAAAGADHVVDAREKDAAKQVLRLTGGAAAAVDFVGAEATAQLGVASLAKGGRLVIVGLFGGAMTVPVPLFPLRSIGIEGSYVGSPREMGELLALAHTGKIRPTPVTERPLAEAGHTLEDLREGRVLGRVVLRP
jgi:D-arabinose 1-dehydrogenase-like Zn-dependent alcohol dehydrogenase